MSTSIVVVGSINLDLAALASRNPSAEDTILGTPFAAARLPARFASAVAAISVTRHGALPSMPTLSEVNFFLEEKSKTKQDIVW